MTLAQLHYVIQAALGWADYHLHQFTVNGVEYGVPHPDDWNEVRNEKSLKLSQFVIGPKFKFTYEYDFGDSWEHSILVEKVLSPEPSVDYPRCITGKRACRPRIVAESGAMPAS